jgi:ABC-type multidrug transport system permease subunit
LAGTGLFDFAGASFTTFFFSLLSVFLDAFSSRFLFTAAGAKVFFAYSFFLGSSFFLGASLVFGITFFSSTFFFCSGFERTLTGS